MERRIYLKTQASGKYESYTGAVIDNTWGYITLIQKTGIGDHEARLYVSVAELKQIVANAEAHKEV